MKKLKAYSLLEVILNLSIVGFVFVSLFSFYVHFKKHYEKKMDFQKFQHISNAMQNYLSIHGHLPCAGNEKGEIVENECAGFVPYKALGIPKEYCFNYKKQRFKYVVNKKFINDGSLILSIYHPTNHVFKHGTTTFARKYCFINGKFFYDNNFRNNIIMLDLNKNEIPLNFFYALPPINQELNSLEDMVKYLYNSNEKKEELMVFNNVAWFLSEKEVVEKIDENFILNEDDVFFQTRFDMLAQLGVYVTTEAIVLN